MGTTAEYFDFDDNPWVRAVSFEDDAGTIHEFAFPEGVCTHEEFLGRLVTAWRQSPPGPSEINRDTLSDLIVMAVLGFWTFLIANLVVSTFLGRAAPAEWVAPPCVIAATTGRCIADLG